VRFQFHSNNGETETNLCSKKVIFIGSEYCVKSLFHTRNGKQQVRVYSPKGKKDFMQNFEACLVDDAVMHVECRGAAVSISTRYSWYCTWRSNNTRSSGVCATGLIQGEGDFFVLNT
jgi:hypothetical protein